ncbi:Stress responsive A/B Barrel Domain protein [Marinomonas spartinae]|uniref:Stress responsive A/B Barrel Domain protein n=1 Tax=Marinomonas spartinae TaxID=1792290 RepID=A0A1A8T461_9GAMM|nr:Dabb family protein [Marinomonas spartinae]SBS26703.1 Stress responsive A/B Barrel Domain protein [Marinomonas spartinae]SBS40272.1 Stress responsive A/B Barrel Domain protein [Marinomonas spartinae]
MIRHVLFIKFKDSATHEDISICFGNFEAIQTKVDGIESVEWGENSSVEDRNKGYSHCVLMTFVDQGSLDHYLPHPEHMALKAQLGPIMEDIIVFDYELS